MQDGKILKAYLDSKKINKQKFATRLKMSKQNLYQLFESNELQPETKANLEAVMGLKWQEIEQVGKALVNIDVNVSKRNGFIRNTPDHRDEIIALLKEISSLKDRSSLEKSLKEYAQVNQALLKAISQTLTEMVAKLDKKKLADAHLEMNRRVAQHLDVLRKEGR